MAESTGSKDLHDSLKHWEVMLLEECSLRQNNEQHLNSKFESLVASQTDLQTVVLHIQTQLQSIADQMQLYNKNKSVLGEGLASPPEKGSTSTHQPTHIHNLDLEFTTSPPQFSSLPRIEFPSFDGDNPRAWVRRFQRYFQVITTIPEEHKVTLVSIHLEGKAELWFQSFVEGQESISWSQFLVAILDHFDDIDPELMIGEFNKLQQTSSVSQYIDKFEELESYMLLFNKDFPEEYFTASFISGLREDIKGSVMTLKPSTLLHAISLAKKQETTINAILHRASSLQKLPPFSKPLFKPPTASFNPTTRAPTFPSKPPFAPQKKLLTASEMRARREKNLCYNCDEVFVPGHRCKQRQIYMIMSQEKEKAYFTDIEPPDLSTDELLSEDMTISINAIYGNSDLNTLRIQGLVKNSSIQILIDSGSTHCFLDETVATTLGCHIEFTNPILISVADGNKIVSLTFCPDFTWEIQGTKFTYPMRIIKLGGCDVVLGGDWLRQHSLVEFDYHKMKLTICRNGKKLIMKDITKSAELHLLSVTTLPHLDDNGNFKVFPATILDRRLIPRNNHPVPQVLIQWNHSSPEQATWEDYSYMAATFPGFDPCGEGSQKRGSNVMTIKGFSQIDLNHPLKMKDNRWIKGYAKELGKIRGSNNDVLSKEGKNGKMTRVYENDTVSTKGVRESDGLDINKTVAQDFIIIQQKLQSAEFHEPGQHSPHLREPIKQRHVAIGREYS
ncbi:hypothetical protein BUALT_Bualt01G0163900 [Buddleja alternifolia]|uniref:Ty3 transposon capsid-like protein domain-containing protein n=1 Tax=Buddleja alternifolia TaxID=168488 RepID=A0AAV6YI39_9LAMI|nr:hypothetical protein BUALT_Bualt01G0163900 [Buddleja alternifolia]